MCDKSVVLQVDHAFHKSYQSMAYFLSQIYTRLIKINQSNNHLPAVLGLINLEVCCGVKEHFMMIDKRWM